MQQSATFPSINNPFLPLLQSRCKKDENLNLTRSAIVFSPHQDDEVLGCGGTIVRKKQAGASLKVVFVTDGSQSHPGLMPAEEIKEIRQKEAIAATNKLGVSKQDVVFLDVKNEAWVKEDISSLASLAMIKQILLEVMPEEIFIPYRYDGHPEHVATHNIVLSALKDCEINTTVYEYPVWFWYTWPWFYRKEIFENTVSIKDKFLILKGNLFNTFRWFTDFNYSIDVQDVLPVKRLALDQYKSQMTPLVPDSEWWTLQGVADGKWLEYCCQQREFFCRYDFTKSNLSHLFK